jgi:hypothetical protein
MRSLLMGLSATGVETPPIPQRLIQILAAWRAAGHTFSPTDLVSARQHRGQELRFSEAWLRRLMSAAT